MYADRVETEAKQSIKDRLNGDSTDDSARRRQVTGKRQRQEEDKWEGDLYIANRSQVSNRVGVQDLRLKLQKKSLQPMSQSLKGSLQGGGIQDLREKLSGRMQSQPVNNNPTKPKAVLVAGKPARETTAAEASVPAYKKLANAASIRKTQQKVDTSITGFLQSLGLEKYRIIFKAEEVDMTTLVHMNDGDLKTLGIPMGPRKKILLALESRD